MKRLVIERVVVEDIGPLEGVIDLGAFDPRTTLITGPNETGKSSLIAAVRAAFFERHNARNAQIRALQPHGTDRSPHVALTFRFEDERYVLDKRFLRGAQALLRREDGAERWEGEAAERKLREILGARAPGRQGARLEHMGVWGLLWVGQDEAAYADPGARLEPRLRETLQDAIAGQVGELTGGPGGERLRERVREEFERYWTPQTVKPSGLYREALEAFEEAQLRCREAERALQETATLRERLEQIEAELRVLEEQRLPSLERELEEARAQAERVAERVRAREEAERALELATRRYEAVRGELERRKKSASELEEREREVERRKALLAARSASWQEAKEKFEDAKRRRAEASEELARLCEERRALELERTRLANAIARNQERLERSKLASLRAERDRLRKACAELPDTSALAGLEAAWQTLERAERALERVGTRFEFEGGGESIVTGTRARVSIDGLGEIECVAADAKFLELRKAREDAELRWKEALARYGVADLEAARRAYRERLEIEARAARARQEVAKLAPEGKGALSEQIAAARADLERLERLCERAVRLGKQRAILERERAQLTVDPSALRALEVAFERVREVRARARANATRLEVQALEAFALVCEREAEPRTKTSLEPNEAWSEAFTRPVRLRVGDLAVIEVRPGAEGIEEIGAEQEAAERAFAELLDHHGVSGIDEARAVATKWQAANDALVRNAEELGELALEAGMEPGENPDALIGRLERERATERTKLTELERREQALLEASARLDKLEGELERHPVDQEALERMEALAEALSMARAGVEQRAARLVVGPRSFVVEQAQTLELHAGVRVRVEPGRGGREETLQWELARERLEERLAGCGLERPEALRAVREQRVRLEARLRELERRVAEREAELGLSGAASEPEDEALELEELEEDVRLALEKRQQRCTTRVEALSRAIEAAERVCEELEQEERLFESKERALAEARVRDEEALRGAETHCARVREELEAERAARPDRELEAEAAELRAAREAARRRFETAMEAEVSARTLGLEEISQGLSQREAALERARQERKNLRERRSRCLGRLEEAIAQGRYERSQEAAARLEAAEERLRGIEHRAKVAKRLFEVVEAAYERFQKRFLAPLRREIEPYIKVLRPASELTMRPDLTIEGVRRGEREEAFDRLSGGTREQLSVIVRIGLAKILARSHAALPLILDDTLGWTDDRRLTKMLEILRDASRDLQIIVLTCHPHRFHALNPGRTIALEQLRAQAHEAGATQG